MTNFIITIPADNMDEPLRQLLSKYQSKGLLTIEESKSVDLTANQRPAKPAKQPPLPSAFVEAVKAVARRAAKQNGKRLPTNDRGHETTYRFHLDAKRMCDAMDVLLKDHEPLLAAMLDGKQRADSVNLLPPFIGELINQNNFCSASTVRKKDLVPAFDAYYGRKISSVQTRLSKSVARMPAAAKVLAQLAKIAQSPG